MHDAQRRFSTRYEISLPAVVKMPNCSLDCKTIDVGRDGVLVKTTAPLTVLFHFEGKQYRGHLVRAMQLDDKGTTEYTIELHDCIDELDPPPRGGLPDKVLQWVEDVESVPTAQPTARQGFEYCG